LIYAYFKSLTCGLIAFASGILVDIDHVLDFTVHYGLKKYRSFFVNMKWLKLHRVFLLFHSYEFLIISWFLVITNPSNTYMISFALGFTQHMLLDRLHNPISQRGYFLIYRIIHKFNGEKIYSSSYLETTRKANG